MSFWDSCPVGRVCASASAFVLLLVIAGCGSGGSDRAPDALSTPEPTIPDSMTIARMLETDDRFSTLRAGLDSTGLDSLLASEGPVTLFAPPNAAFDELPPGTMETLLAERRQRLRTILAKHVIERRLSLDEVSDSQRVAALNGDTLTLRRTGGGTTVDDVRVLDDGIEAANGLVHVVERVLPPPSGESQTE